MRFKFIQQKDIMQCGIACLAMVCRYWGVKIPLKNLENICPPTKEGVSMLALSNTANILHLQNTTLKITISKLKQIPFPCILHWNQNHFVVLYKIKNNRFYIADPGKGKIIYNENEFKNHWICDLFNADEKGIVMILKPNEYFGDFQEQNISTKYSFKFLFNRIKNYHKLFFQIFLGLLLGCLFQLIMPFLTQSIVDIGIKNNDINFIWLILLGELFIIIGKTATEFIRRWLLLHISMRLNISLISDFFIKLLKLPMAFFETKLLGDIMQRISDHNRIQAFLTSQVLNIIFTFLSFVIFGIVLLIYDSFIFGIFLISCIIHILWILLFLNRRKILDYELFEKQSKNQNKTYQFISNMQEIKLQDCELRRRWEWEDTQADIFTIQTKTLKLQQIQEAGSIFINEVKNIIITVLSATAVINGDITLGGMLAIQYIIGQLNSPVEQFMAFIYSIQDVKISLERINEIHESNNEENRNNYIDEYINDNRSIDICNINFKYDLHSQKNILNNISFKIPQGKVTAIVGASGSGKTTLIKLLLGYYPVQSGSIKISNRDINNYNLKWWRKQCGVVMQDGVIFSESIARNIAVSDDEICVERIEQAAKIANIHDFIMKLPLKYNTIIGRDGIGVSQGQKQRILIARAVYKNPDFIFLDEATNALDAQNERIIVQNLSEYYKGRTVIIVAHRLSTVKNADQIIVLDHGNIIEVGNHEELISKKSIYFNLIKNQLELGV